MRGESKMKLISIIPARYQSSRFFGKPLALINGKPMIQWVYESVSKVEKINDVYVATDDQRIFDRVVAFGGKVIMTSDKHTCGSDRLAECAEILKLNDEDIILNIQGDEPLIKEEMIEDLISTFNEPDVYMGTLKKKIEVLEEINNPNVVKVITTNNGYAMIFSRYALPYNRDGKESVTYFKHVGAYGYKKWFLIEYSKMPKLLLETVESLEQLRVLENGYKIKVIETKFQSIGVDMPEQIAQVESQMKQEGIVKNRYLSV
jgi:3-deoxy-manno-octulosonate cytidylyltransferase (CMP-KDO synthetase)